MAARGPYAKGVAKRAEILDTALDVIAVHGYSGATVKELADAAGLSQNGLLHYFGSKDALFVEILRYHDTRLTERIDPEHTDFARDLVRRILDALSDSTTAPGMSQLVLSVSAAASESDHAAHAFIGARQDAFRTITEGALRQLQKDGGFPADADAAAAAALITAAFDGLQLQWLYDRSIDVVGRMAYLLDNLGITESPPTPAG